MKGHRPWQPHLDRDPLFNPFVPTTVRPFGGDHVELAPEETEEGEEPTSEQPLEQSIPDQSEEAKKE